MDMQASSRQVLRPARHLVFLVATLLLLLFQFLLIPTAIANPCGADDVASLSCGAVVDPGKVRSPVSEYRHVGNPVDVISGSKQQHDMDYQAIGSPLHFGRYYHSSQTDSNTSLGQGWRHSYSVNLYSVDAEHWRIQQADGRWIDFTLVKSGSDTESKADSQRQLFHARYEGDGYLVKDGAVSWILPDGRIMHFQGSFLTRIDYPHGVNLHLFYKNRTLVSVSDKQGRELRLEYSAGRSGLPDYEQSLSGIHKGHLNALHLPSGERIGFFYDSNRNLIRVAYPDGHESKYQFANTTYPNHLSAITTTLNGLVDTRTWTYDSDGRVIKFDHPTLDKSMSLAYENDATVADDGVTIVDYASGRQEQYRWKAESERADAHVTDVRVMDCNDCQAIHFQPQQRSAQTPDDVIAQERTAVQGQKRVDSQPSSIVDDISNAVLPAFEQFAPLPQSFDQQTPITIDGNRYSVLINVSRLGEVNDISVGSTSLSELKNKWAQGNIEKCDAQPRLRRSLIYPSPEKGCLEDLIYLVDLSRHIERISRQHGLKQTVPTQRSGGAGSARSVCLINPFRSCKELERNFQLAQLSGCAYRDLIQICAERWQVVAPQSLGLDDSLFNDGSFSSTLFYNQDTGEYILAFRGTDNLGDWKDNFLQASGEATPQYKKAVVLARELEQVLPTAALAFTGHSLGGGLATAAALSIDAPATVFNPAALHPDTAAALTLDYAAAQTLVDVTTVDGDLLTSIQQSGSQFTSNQSPVAGRFPAPGKHTVLAAPSDDWIGEKKEHYPILARSDGAVLHSIDAVLETEDNLLVEHCGKTPSRA